MMRLPQFRYLAPSSVDEVAKILRNEGPQAMILAGGTDLFPNMKRRQQTPKVVVSLQNLKKEKAPKKDGKNTLFHPMATLTEISESSVVRESYGAFFKAAFQVATPQIRNTATLGGNLCLDTRCNYYDQNYEWRQAIDFCMKKDGEVCWVAPSSPRCWAVSSTDTAPALVALGSKVRLQSVGGKREIDLKDFYADDGITYLNKKPDEVLTDIVLPELKDWKSTYWKLRRRGSFDFPILSVAAALKLKKKVVEDVRIVLGAVASYPVLCKNSSEVLLGQKLTDDKIEEAAELAWKPSKPMDNTDFDLGWRKKMVRKFVVGALKELRGDEVKDIKLRSTRVELPSYSAVRV